MKKIVFISGLVSGLLTSGFILPASSQVTSDNTTNTTINQNGNNFNIINGIQKGNNLFHSFGEFSIPKGGSATFNNSTNVVNIINRVTGGSISNIDGLIKAQGNANLFLINPAGIIFGENASLDIGGSFFGSTAESILFKNGFEFSAVNPEEKPLLTVSVPFGLQMGTNPGAINNRSTVDGVGLEVAPGRSLVLAGGTIALEGGMRSPGGQIELLSVAEAGRLDLTIDGNDIRLSMPKNLQRADVSLSDGAQANVSGTPGGRITVKANNLNLSEGSELRSGISGIGLPESQAGNIEIDAANTINMYESGIRNQVATGMVGNAGNIDIVTGSLFVNNGSYIVTNTRGTGNAGEVNIQATKTVSFDGVNSFGYASELFTGVNGGAIGNGGELNITAESLYVADGVYLASSTLGRGNAGTINFQTKTATFTGQDDKGNSTFVSTAVATGGIGMGGDLNIKTDELFVKEGAFLSTATLGKGDGGTMNIDAITASFDGFGKTGVASFASSAVNPTADGNGGTININANLLSVTNGALLTTITGKPGSAGDINVNANQLEVLNGGQILSTSFGSGKAGRLTFNVKDKIILSGSDPMYFERSLLPGFNDASNTGAASGLFANTGEDATGAGGDLQIRTGKLLIQDGASVSVSNLGMGNAGNLLVTADSIRLRNAASLSAESRAGSQGNIILNAGDLILRDGSNVTTNAMGLATGGNIKIDSAVIAGFENSDISANAVEGNGGQIDIITQGIFGLEFRNELTEESDITASSEFGVNGTVAINNISIDPSSGLVELAVDLVDGSQQIASGCSNNSDNTFVATGRGGIPKNPNQQVDVNPTWSDIRDLSAYRKQNNNTVENTQISNKPAIVEATGFIRNENGEIELVAAQNTSLKTKQVPNCSGLST